MNEDPKNRESMTSTELDAVLGRIAAMDRSESIRSEDLLDYVEGAASQSQTNTIHRALACSASLRAEFFDFLQELSNFDIGAVNAAIAKIEASPVPALDRLAAHGGDQRAGHDSTRGTTRWRPWQKWGGALAAAAALVLILRPFGGETPPSPGDAGPISIVAATRAFDPGVRRGLADSNLIGVTIADASHAWVAIWVPESWAGMSESLLTVTASIDDDPTWQPMPFQFATHGGDPAVLVQFERSRLHRGVLSVRLRKEASGDTAEREVVARLRLEEAP